MVRYFYPAIVRRLDTGEYRASLPNFAGIEETGRSLGGLMDALKKDIGDYLYGKNTDEFQPVEPDTLQVTSPAFLLMIEFDEFAYNKKHHGKAVTKAVTIPAWMNDLVKQQNLPISKLLQDAIIQHLAIEN